MRHLTATASSSEWLPGISITKYSFFQVLSFVAVYSVSVWTPFVCQFTGPSTDSFSFVFEYPCSCCRKRNYLRRELKQCHWLSVCSPFPFHLSHSIIFFISAVRMVHFKDAQPSFKSRSFCPDTSALEHVHTTSTPLIHGIKILDCPPSLFKTQEQPTFSIHTFQLKSVHSTACPCIAMPVITYQASLFGTTEPDLQTAGASWQQR